MSSKLLKGRIFGRFNFENKKCIFFTHLSLLLIQFSLFWSDQSTFVIGSQHVKFFFQLEVQGRGDLMKRFLKKCISYLLAFHEQRNTIEGCSNSSYCSKCHKKEGKSDREQDSTYVHSWQDNSDDFHENTKDPSPPVLFLNDGYFSQSIGDGFSYFSTCWHLLRL